MKKLGLSHTRPRNEARPLGMPKPKKINRADAARLKIVERARRDAGDTVGTNPHDLGMKKM